MHALALTDDGPALVDRPLPDRPDEARVRVLRAGICATDLELVRGYMHFRGVLGHEFVGVVEQAPGPALVGRRVVGDINVACGACPTCLAGRPTHCPTRTVLGIVGRDGVFASHTSLPVGNLHPVPDAISDEAAAFVEPLAAACEILDQVHVRPTDRVVVLGVGRLGQLCARVLALTGAEVVGVGRPERTALLPAGIGRSTVDDARGGADVVVDCTGSPDGLRVATGLVRPRGVVVLKTTTHVDPTVPAARWVIDEITLVGSRCGPFDAAIRLLASGSVDVRPLITDVLPLSRGLEALALAARPDVLKLQLAP